MPLIRLSCLLSLLVVLAHAAPVAPPPETKRHTVTAAAKFREDDDCTKLVVSADTQKFEIDWALKITSKDVVGDLPAERQKMLAKGIRLYPFKLVPSETYTFTIEEEHHRIILRTLPGLESEKGIDEYFTHTIVRVVLGNAVIYDAEVCEVHHRKMARKEVPVAYGLIPLESESDRKAFPHCPEFVRGGCIGGPERTALVYICPDCEKARAERERKPAPKSK